MVQIFSKDPFHVNNCSYYDFYFLPGAQVPRKFDFQTMKASITIPPIPKYNLSGFIFCTVLSEGFHVHNHPLHCIILEHGKEVDRCIIGFNFYIGSLISDHVLISWYCYKREKFGSNDCNLSFQFTHNLELQWSTEAIKGCGVLPVYNLEHKSDLDGRKVGKLKFSAQYSDGSDWSNNESEDGQENYNDELQPTAIGGEVISSNNENEEDQKHPCCSVGMNLLIHFLIINSILVYFYIQ